MSNLWVFLIVLASSPAATWAGDWPGWRGPGRHGHVAEHSGWDGKAWRIKELWRSHVGEGCTSPVLVGDRVFVLGSHAGKDFLQCLRLDNGKVDWQQEYKAAQYGRHAAGDQGVYSGVSSTPEFDTTTGLLYTLGVDGALNCWDTTQKGKLVWSLNLYDEYRASQRPKVGRSPIRDYGYTSSPLLHNDTLIVEVGAKAGCLIGFDKRTGKQMWASELAAPAGHNGGPVLMTVEGVPCVAVHNHDGLLVVRLDKGREGKTVATYPWRTEFANNVASPTVEGDSILLTSNYNINKIARLKITLQGATVVWQKNLASKVCPPVVHKGRVYWAWMKLHCLDFATGEPIWDTPGFSDPGSCVVTSDGKLLVYSSQGKLTLAETGGKQFQRLGELKVLSRINAWPHVVLANGRVLCKDAAGDLVCLNVEQGK